MSVLWKISGPATRTLIIRLVCDADLRKLKGVVHNLTIAEALEVLK